MKMSVKMQKSAEKLLKNGQKLINWPKLIS